MSDPLTKEFFAIVDADATELGRIPLERLTAPDTPKRSHLTDFAKRERRRLRRENRRRQAAEAKAKRRHKPQTNCVCVSCGHPTYERRGDLLKAAAPRCSRCGGRVVLRKFAS